ncbi:MAG TPA: haloacid dehalogenase type II [Candidatus Cybelea sp.]|nr:haloacid dehalogenase type II [Candidatus Cybelea sp.]
MTGQAVRACVFDAYGTLFDVAAAARHCSAELGDRWQPLADLWRAKQLNYTWLRSLMGRHADFWQVTGEALDVAMASLGLSNAGLRQRLMDLYLRLEAYPEVPAVLRRLKASGRACAVLSNGSPKMLKAAVDHAGIGELLDHVISIEDAGIYKPHPSVYRLAVERLGVPARQMTFQSSNAWDAHAAQAFGFRSIWINRFGQPREPLPERPEAELTSLADVPAIVEAMRP